MTELGKTAARRTCGGGHRRAGKQPLPVHNYGNETMYLHAREHRIGRLVYLEPHESIVAAIACEKVLKNSDGLENSLDRSG